MPPFQCYEVDHAKFNLPGVSLTDQFGARTASVTTGKRLCNPTDLNGGEPGALDDAEHLVGYSLVRTEPPFTPVRGLQVTNALGTFTVDVLKPTRLFVPSAKSLTGPPPPLASVDQFDHFSCYRVRAQPASSTVMTITDEFGTKTEKILNMEQLCVPVDKNGSGIPSPALQLTCFKTRYVGVSFRGPGGPVFVDNQFGAATLQVSHGEELCLPSSP